MPDFDCRFLGPPVEDLAGLEVVAGPRETGDSYPVAPLRFQTLLDMEEPEASGRSFTIDPDVRALIRKMSEANPAEEFL